MNNSNLDLVFERTTRIPVAKLWEAWTSPSRLPQWFCPRPWRVTDCRTDLRPGGEFFTVMAGPNGERVENHGCYLEVVPDQKLVWTNVLSQGYRPAAITAPGFPFVATVTFAPAQGQTLYRAVVAHADEAGKRQHEAMGFQAGWGAAFAQLEELFR